MKKTLAFLTPALALAAVLAAPLSAQAHRAWLAPTSTVLSGNDAWVGFDAGMSNGVFIPDHAAMRLAGLTITAPDGSTAQAENVTQAKYRSSFDLHLSQPGTYRVANVGSGFMASYKQGGEQKRWRGAEADFATAQRKQIDVFRAAHTLGEAARATVARVIVPTDGATAAQREKYAAYVEGRTPRTKTVHGGRTLIAPDVTGTNSEIVDFILGDPAFQAADDYLFELPFEFELADWKQILDQLANEIAPRLGWCPAK